MLHVSTKGLFVLRLLSILLAALLIGCTGSPAEPTAEPIDSLALVKEAAANIRSADTFRISVEQAGPDYQIYTEYTTVLFRRATAQYVAPGTMQAAIRVIAAGLPIDIEVFSRGAAQWYRAIWTGNQWVEQPFAPDFNPEMLIAEETGIEAALQSLIELDFVGETNLENGAPVYHLSASANGPDVSALLGGLIEPVGVVGVDVYIHRETRYPARFVITEQDSPYAVTPEPGMENEPIIWTIDVYDVDAPAELATPEIAAPALDLPGIGAPQGVTPEVTSEATAEATATKDAP